MCRGSAVVRLVQCCQPCGFPANLGLLFVDLRFLKICGFLDFGLVLIKSCSFFGLVFCKFLFCGLHFFQILWHYCRFSLLQNEIWAWFCVNLHILGLFFRICLPAFIFDLPASFTFFEFPYQTHVRLVFFLLIYLFFACFSNLLSCFYKITWHHCTVSTAAGYAVGRRTIPCIENCWDRPRGLQKIVYFNWGSTCRTVWEPLGCALKLFKSQNFA